MPNDDDNDIFGSLGKLKDALMGNLGDEPSRPSKHLCSGCGSTDTIVSFTCVCGEFNLSTCGVPGCFKPESFFTMLKEHSFSCNPLMEQVNAYKTRRGL